MASRKAPVRHTCPDIDELLKRVKSIQSSIKNIESLARQIEHSENEDIKSDIMYHVSQIDHDIWMFDDKLEELRNSNEGLRNWGNELVEELEELENQLE
ncbi:hypothetical protein [Runella salmonicolor]|uniref:Uncharacterized protein n=1 Tax=Runella salmonicolor TaxID=2950278 RepID=A0ABT1FSN9_9BACT|nr:hypothetical protein [Runella salmonicolor]MCP1384777.1 hypothetical protein [Runella salmonicolor]